MHAEGFKGVCKQRRQSLLKPFAHGSSLHHRVNAGQRAVVFLAEDDVPSPGDMKLRSCATLFASVSQPGSAFHRLLDKYYQGERDSKTLRLLGIASDVK
jgi:uncharacterized protein (DUF1810 family)